MPGQSHLGYGPVTAFVARSALSFFEFGSMKSYGVIVEELTRQADLSFTATGLILPLQRTVTYLSGPISSAALGIFDARTMMVIGGMLVGLGYIGNGILPWSPVSLMICCVTIGIGFGAGWVPSYVNLKTNFSGDKQFSIAQTMTDQFGFIGMATLPILFERFQDGYGVRGALVLFGAGMFHLVVTSLLVRPHETSGTRDPGSLRGYCDLLLSNPEVGYVTCVAGLHSYSGSTWALFSVILGEEKGLPTSEAVLLSSAFGFGAIFGRIWCLGLFAIDVCRPFINFGVPSLVQCVSLVCLAMVEGTFWSLMLLSFVVGSTLGAMGPALGGMCSLITRSEKEFQAAVVMCFLGVGVGSELGGGISGAVYDYHGSGEKVFLTAAANSFLLTIISVAWSVTTTRFSEI